MPALAELSALRETILGASLEPCTCKGYTIAFRHWTTFVHNYHFDLLPNTNSLSLFISWHWSVSVSVYPLLSGLAFHLRPLMTSPTWDQVRSAPLVLQVLRGGQKWRAHRPRKAILLHHKDITRMVKKALDSRVCYDDLLWTAMLTVLFTCCGRAEEVSMLDGIQFRNSKKEMRRDGATITPRSFTALLPYHKADPLYTGSHYFFVMKQVGEDWSHLVHNWARVWDCLFGQSDVLFLKSDGTVPTRSWFVRQLKKRLGKQYTGHSSCPGGATWYVLLSWDDTTIKQQGARPLVVQGMGGLRSSHSRGLALMIWQAWERSVALA